MGVLLLRSVHGSAL